MMWQLLVAAFASILLTGTSHSIIRTENDKFEALEVSSVGTVKKEKLERRRMEAKDCVALGDFVLAITASGGINGYVPADSSASAPQEFVAMPASTSINGQALSATMGGGWQITTSQGSDGQHCPTAWLLDANGLAYFGKPKDPSMPTGDWNFSLFNSTMTFTAFDAGTDYVFFLKKACLFSAAAEKANITNYCMWYTGVDGAYRQQTGTDANTGAATSIGIYLPMWNPWTNRTLGMFPATTGINNAVNNTANNISQTAMNIVQVQAFSAGVSSIWVVDTFGNISSCSHPCAAMCVVTNPFDALQTECIDASVVNSPVRNIGATAQNPWVSAFISKNTLGAFVPQVGVGLRTSRFDVSTGGSIGLWYGLTSASCSNVAQVWSRMPSGDKQQPTKVGTQNWQNSVDQLNCLGSSSGTSSNCSCSWYGPGSVPGSLPFTPVLGSTVFTIVAATDNFVWMAQSGSGSSTNKLWSCYQNCETNAWTNIPSEKLMAMDR